MRAILTILLIAGAAVAAYLGIQHFSASPDADGAARPPAVDAPSEQQIDIADATVRVRQDGPADAPVIVLLHGFSFSLETWDAWADALSSDYRVVRYDLLGHGMTGPDPQERYSPKERAAFIGEVLDALGHDQVILGGNSLGGLAAWRFAAMQPERVEALILVSPGAFPINGVADEPVAVPPLVASYLRTVPEIGLRASLGQIYADPGALSEERIRTLGTMMRQPGNGEAMVKSLEEFTLPDPVSDLAKVVAPTLVLWGEADQVIPPDHAGRLVAALPNGTLKSYPNIGHVAHEEAPDQTVQDVRAFLSTLD